MTTSEIEHRLRHEELEAAAFAAECSQRDHAQWLESPEGIRAMDLLAEREAQHE